MKVVLADRGMGKTRRAVLLAHEVNAYMVVGSHIQARMVQGMAVEMGLVGLHFPITFDELVRGEFYGRGIRGLMVDNADDLIRVLCRGVPLVGLTMARGD